MTRRRTATISVITAVSLLISFPLAGGASASNNTDKNAKVLQKPKTSKPQLRLPKDGTRLGIMFIPRLKVRSPMVEGVTDAMFDIGMGHWPGTAMPGKKGNAVYGAHRTAGPAPLFNVERIRKGDSIIILRGLKRTQYKVTSTFIVKPTALWITNQTRNSMLTLFTCHPRHSTKQRYVVQAVLKK